jgi:hypothetical protein
MQKEEEKEITAHIPFTTTNARKKNTHTHTRKKAKVLSAFFFLFSKRTVQNFNFYFCS